MSKESSTPQHLRYNPEKLRKTPTPELRALLAWLEKGGKSDWPGVQKIVDAMIQDARAELEAREKAEKAITQKEEPCISVDTKASSLPKTKDEKG